MNPEPDRNCPMRLTDILQAACVKVPLAADSKEQAIYELVDLLADQVGIENRDQLKKAVWQRELTRTTGIGHGVGIPHGKSEGISKLCMAIGRTAKPIEFGSIDRKPVDLILLLASPADQTGPHIQALATISRMLTDSAFRGAIRAAVSSSELYRIISEQETKEVVS
jgi:fructose-specific phosphotransferase system IIA component